MVNKYKLHPAILLWGFGNEKNFYASRQRVLETQQQLEILGNRKSGDRMKVRFRDTQGRGQNPDILGTRRPWDVFCSYGDPMFWGTNLGPTGPGPPV